MKGKLAIFIVFLMALFINITNVNALSYTNLKGEYYYNESYEILKLVNEERKKYGLDELVMDKDLFNSANKRAAEIVIYMNETHYRPNGKAYSTISPKVKGENTGYIYGYDNISKNIFKSWMNSKSHRKNILDKDYKSIGIGCFKYNDTYYFVQEFGYNDIDELVNYPNNKKAEVRVEYLDKLDKKGVTFDKPIYEIKDTGYITLTSYNMDNKYTIFKSNNNIKLTLVNNKIKVDVLRPGITQVLIKYASGEYASTFVITGNIKNNKIDKEYIKVCGTTFNIDADMKPIDTINNYKYGIKDTNIYSNYINKNGENILYSKDKIYILNINNNSYNIYVNNKSKNDIISTILNKSNDNIYNIIRNNMEIIKIRMF